MKVIILVLGVATIITPPMNAQDIPISQVEGYLEVYHPDDTTSIYLGISSGQSVVNSRQMNNTFYGTNSGRDNTDGGDNAFFGVRSGERNIDGSLNSFFGALSGRSNTTGVPAKTPKTPHQQEL